MIDKYRDELLKSFLDNYSRVYLIDLEKDTIVKIQESEGAPEFDPVRQNRYSEFNRVYSYTMLEPEYSQWREMMGSVENIRKVLADRNSFTLSYQMKDGRWMKVENRILEKRDGVPVKVFACIPKEETDRLAENEKILEDRHDLSSLVTSSERRHREAREKLYKGVLAIDTLSTCEVNVTRNTVIAAIGNKGGQDPLGQCRPVPGTDDQREPDHTVRDGRERSLDRVYGEGQVRQQSLAQRDHRALQER